MSVKHKTVSTRILKHRYQNALSSGLDSEYILRYTGISETDANNLEGRVSYASYLRFNQFLKLHGFSVLEESIWQLSIESMLEEMGSLIALCINQPDARQALNTFVRYRCLIGESDYLYCNQEGDLVTIQFSGENYASLTDEVLTSSALANFIILVNLISFYSGSEKRCFNVRFSHEALFDTEMYKNFFCGEVQFNQSGNFLQFDSRILDAQNPSFHLLLEPYLRSQVESEMAGFKSLNGFSSLVKGKILALEKSAGFDDSMNTRLCELLGISRWTLRRRLAEEGYTFQSVLAEVRAEKAKHYLMDTGLKIGEISDLLGFSSQSAFTRFFISQEKVSPAEFRKQNQVLLG